jgi:Fur family zinc uptake transcriptional regulator
VWSSHAPIKAYEILEQVHKHNPKAAPPTVYRALDFLMEAGLVHKLESINAFIGCDRPGQPHVGQFLICKTCGVAAEIHKPQITRMLSREARQLGFETQQQMVEIQGQCARCMKS